MKGEEFVFWHQLRATLQTWLDRPLRPKKNLGEYRIETVLGAGSYGIAYLVRHEKSDTLYVAKQIKRSRNGKPKGLAMQEYEAKVLKSLQHPLIPRFIEQFAYQNKSFLIMSYIDGVPLEDVLFTHGKIYNEKEALILLKKIAQIVQALHEQGVIHRDVRIPNIILLNDEPYIIDFGLARFLGDSPSYEARDLAEYPLEKQVKREVHPKSDLYALGHLLLFLLYSAYEPAHSEEKNWEEELALRPPLRTMLRKLLQLDEPYESVQELVNAIDQLLQEK